MLSMVFGLPLVFGVVVWRSYRSADARSQRGEALVPEGAERWEPDEVG